MNEVVFDWRRQQEIFKMPIQKIAESIFDSIGSLDLVSAERLLVARFGELDWEPLQSVLAHLVFAYEYMGEEQEAARFERALIKLHSADHA